MTNRRDFIRQSAFLGGSLALGLRSRLWAERIEPASASLSILILGGTGLTGPFQVRYAVARGHKVTVFNRGRNNKVLPAGVTELVGDRNLHQLDALKGKTWDAVIDNPTTLPFWVRDAGEILKDSTKQYVFISTISVYDTTTPRSIDESSPLVTYTKGDPMAVTMQDMMKDVENLYGEMKTASEHEAVKWFGDRTTIIRPTLIAGPGDLSFRYTYWPYRIAKGGDVLAPGDGLDHVQIIDARDLAEWTIRMLESRTTGTFNGAGPAKPMTMADELEKTRQAVAAGRDVRFTWVPADFLAAHKVSAWGNMPTWVPRSDPDSSGMNVSNARALAAGLTFRPLGTTAVDSLAWFNEQPTESQDKMRQSAGLAPDREREVLAAWRARGSGS